ncbi:hypothetical protein B0I35DRAFT_406367 [Stachybotrys elegans]|uniref:Uncharacterized protein n=1 Tax=Stachybotrys elegans TaxID=80388 RepID=A0A8K0SVQ2_9HYPO|nr:hypothetical protein B0I35DRAFT_406367 [Stachybotrys elegans]
MYSLASIFTVTLAAAGVIASPNLQARQEGVVYVQFFTEEGCQGNFREDTVYFDNGEGACDIETYQGPYASWRVVRNGAVNSLSVYSNDDCTTNNSGNVITVPAGSVTLYGNA